MEEYSFNPNFPTVDDLRSRAQKRIPRFAFEFLDGGCNEDVNVRRNTSDIRDIQLKPHYLRPYAGSDMRTNLFGHTYDAPFGIAPMGLQGLIWPNSPEILAKAAYDHNVPFITSCCTTSTLERIADLTNGRSWFQLYHPAENSLRDKIIKRVEDVDCPVLVIVCDVPTLGFRPRDIRNGLAMPPKMTLRNFIQIALRPSWALRTLAIGQPEFEILKPYMPKRLNMKELGRFMQRTFSGRLNEDKIAPIRERWKGKLVLKGVASEEDVEIAHKLGVDGVVISNHGGRQLDAGESALQSLRSAVTSYGEKLTIMMDSGIRSGPDIARTIACGAKFTLLGRPFMYGTAALGDKGGDHTISILKAQLNQLMEQICCERIEDLPKHLIN